MEMKGDDNSRNSSGNNNSKKGINFDQMANYILNRTVIVCNDNILRICEIEFYLKSVDHNDPYVHDTSEQHTYGNWYFHKHHTGTYKGGTFKGLDITFGSLKSACGILIRSVMCLGNSVSGSVNTKQVIEGPCKTVNKLLELLEVKSIMDFTQGNTIAINHEKLKLIEIQTPTTDIIVKGPRIGLSNKNIEYQNAEYRFAIKGLVKKAVRSLH